MLVADSHPLGNRDVEMRTVHQMDMKTVEVWRVKEDGSPQPGRFYSWNTRVNSFA